MLVSIHPHPRYLHHDHSLTRLSRLSILISSGNGIRRSIPKGSGRLADMLQSVHRPVWETSEGEELWRDAVRMIDSSYLAQSSDATYAKNWSVFEQFCRRLKVKALPASAETITTFIASQVKDGMKLSTIRARLAAISSCHSAYGLQGPSSHHLVNMAKRSAMRICGTKVRHAHVLKVEHLEAMFKVVDMLDTTAVRNFTMIMLSFTGFLRANEVVALNAEDVWTEELDLDEGRFLCVFVLIAKSKTDQYRHGDVIVITSPRQDHLNPVVWVMMWKEVRDSSASVFFHRIGEREDKHKPLAASSYNHIIKNLASAAGLGHLGLTGHSSRAGGVTAAAARGINERLLRRHGRWKSDAIHLYIHESIESRISVTRDLTDGAVKSSSFMHE